MSISPFIPKDFYSDPCQTLPTVIVYTHTPAVLFLTYSRRRPRRRQRTTTFQGVTQNCGWYDVFEGERCIRQNEPQASVSHSFTLPTMPCATRLYYVISDHCAFESPFQGTPVQQYFYRCCDPGVSFAKVQAQNQPTNSINPTILWQTLTAGNPNYWVVPTGVSLRTINHRTHALYSLGSARVSAAPNITPGTYRIAIRKHFPPPLEIFAEDQQPYSMGSTFHWAINRIAPIQDNHRFDVTLTRLSGNGFIVMLNPHHPGFFAINEFIG